MKILKFTLLAILLKVVYSSSLIAQPMPVTTPPCPEVSELIIQEIENDQLLFNTGDFYDFDTYHLQMYIENACADRNKDIDCPPGVWIEVPDGRPNDSGETIFEICNSYIFRVKVICGKEVFFSDSKHYVYEDKTCDKFFKKLNNDFVILSPQPALSYVNIYNSNEMSLESIVIRNIQGQQIMRVENKNKSTILKLDLPNLQAGIYMAEIRNSDQSIFFKKMTIR